MCNQCEKTLELACLALTGFSRALDASAEYIKRLEMDLISKGDSGVFIDGAKKDKKLCKKSDNGACTECKTASLFLQYGYASGFGLGTYHECDTCGAVFDFSEDSGD